ncbi:hypothetical protein KKD03_03850 [Patescibacteria group bacterium]|nr:hypothetical protein [Patescibacteria group bacterium]
MQQHPIPQDITGYRFHIVGSMTLKQFGEVLASVIIAVIFYNTNLLAIVKWPLIIFTIMLGIIAAFVPIQEKPLTHWISTFVGVMYRPTKFFWRKEATIPEYFLFQSQQSTIVQEPEMDLTPAKRQRIKEYLGSVPETSSFSTDFSQEEVNRMKDILSSFQTVQITTKTTVTNKTTKEKPKLDIRIRGMRAPKKIMEFSNPLLDDDSSEPASMFEIIKETKKVTKGIKKSALPNDQVAHNIEIPEEDTVKLTSEENEKEKELIGAISSDSSEKTFIKDQIPSNKNLGITKDVSFNSNLPFPIKPSKPNKLVGMILSKNNDLLSDSIVEVQTLEGEIERAVKTNALGQFFITTPLKVGEYNVVIEKKGYIFEPMHIEIDGSIIQPIEIRSEN